MNERFGRWEVLRKDGRDWQCRCDCGTISAWWAYVFIALAAFLLGVMCG